MGKKNKRDLFRYIIYFIIFSFIGSLIEYSFKFFGGAGIAYDQGLYKLLNIKLYFIPLYGLVGLSLVLLENFLEKLKKPKIKFVYFGLFNALIIILWELIAGLACIFAFGYVFWDYSGYFLDFMGIISLQVSLLWVVIGYLFSFIYEFIIKKYESPDKQIPHKSL